MNKFDTEGLLIFSDVFGPVDDSVFTVMSEASFMCATNDSTSTVMTESATTMTATRDNATPFTEINCESNAANEYLN